MAKTLGKGLSALIAQKADNIEQKVAENISNGIETISDNAHSILELNLTDIIAGQFQPRTNFDNKQLKELADSIKKNGVFQPIIVRKLNDDNIPEKYEIIAGERRFRASKICKKTVIPAIIMELEDREALEIGIIENVQRQDLKVLEVADGYQRLIDEFEYTQDDLSKIIGKNRSTIANSIRLLSLPDEIKTMIDKDDISAGHARALLTAKDPLNIAKKIISKGLNVRQVEDIVQKANNPQPKVNKNVVAPVILGDTLDIVATDDVSHKDLNDVLDNTPSLLDVENTADVNPSPEDEELMKLEEEISDKIGYKVNITNSSGAGEVKISYQSLQELGDLLLKLNRAIKNIAL